MDNSENKLNDEEYVLETYSDFEDMGIKDDLLRGIYAYGFENPSSIQQKAIKPIIDKRDVIGQAQSGTGKTGTFSIAMLNNINENLNEIQSIVLSPTRELSNQIYKIICQLSQYMNIKIMKAIGGTSLNSNMDEFNNIPHVIVGTPGRIIDIFSRKSQIKLNTVKLIVLDESDEMLSRGFKDQIAEIFNIIKTQPQVAIFSATLNDEILDITQYFMKNPIKILVKNDELTLEGIRQYYVNVTKEDWKLDTLCDIYETISTSQSIIYCNSKKKVEWLTNQLRNRDFTVNSIHGEMEQDERTKIMEDFVLGHARILITTNLLARGIDVQQVSVVINYDIPHQLDNYIHRIGRSGRFGRKGLAINFITYKDTRHIRDIESYYSTQIEELPTNFAEYM